LIIIDLFPKGDKYILQDKKKAFKNFEPGYILGPGIACVPA
jgi:hypothetical protein